MPTSRRNCVSRRARSRRTPDRGPGCALGEQPSGVGNEDLPPPVNAGPGNTARANLTALIESAEDYIWSVDLDFRLLTCNHVLQQDFETGFGTIAAAGMSSEELMPPEIALNWPPLYARALGEGPFRIENPFVGGRMLEFSLSPILINGKAAGISVFGKDITERKAAELALQRAEKKYRDIFDGALEGMFQTTLEGRPMSANPALARMLGYDSPQELLASVRDLATEVWAVPGDRDRYLAQLEERGAILGFECQYKRKDGSPMWVSINTRKVCGADGAVLYLEGFIEDITERRRSAQALKESEAHFRATFEGTGSVMLLIDPASSSIVAANPAASRYYGYPLERLVGMTIDQIDTLPLEEIARVGELMLREERTCFNFEHRLASGEVRDVEVYASPVTMNGVQLALSIVHDVTERKRIERELRDSEERYRATFEQVAVGIVHTSFEGRFMRCNARFAEIVGYAQDEIPGLTFQQITPPEDLAESMAVLKSMSGNACATASFDKRYVRKDGSPIWVRVTSSTQKDGQGNALHYIALIEDINARKLAEERLAASTRAEQLIEARYRTVFQTSLDCIVVSRLSDGKYIDVNKAFLDLLGFSYEEVIGRTSIELSIWVDCGYREKMVEALRLHSNVKDARTQYRKKDGSIVWVLISATSIEIEGVACILSVMRDVSDAMASEECLARAQEALRSSEERYRAAFQTSLDAISINRMSDGVYIECNQAFLTNSGYERHEVIGKTSSEIGIWAHEDDLVKLLETLGQMGNCRDMEAQFRKKNGEMVWGLMSASPIEVDGVACVLAVTRDITEAKQAEDEIRNLSFYDPLTRLPNRRMLLERLRQSRGAIHRTHRKRALLFVDLDDFKTLNDTLGHETGDLLLKEASKRLAVCARDGDTLARLGGDEFVVMLDDLSELAEEAASQAKAEAEKILAALRQPYRLSGRECLSTASIGITVFGDEHDSGDRVLQQADIAMFQAKAAGRNTLRFFAPALQAAVNARATLEEELRQAIRAGEFLLYFQPQVRREQTVGAEALVRWQHPTRGLLLPGEFIPLAEETGLILPLGSWVMDAACRQVAAWAGRGDASEFTLAVNISARQLRQPDFVDEVLGALRRSGADPCKLKLELTESMLVDNIEDVVAKMTRLNSHGLRFSLDDFGTGYSSLSYLKRLPLDQLKIDRSFVRDILADASSGAIAQTIVSLSQAMGLGVIAEGVETEAQRDFLAGLGCDSFQGYLYGRPAPLEAFERLIPGSAPCEVPIGL